MKHKLKPQYYRWTRIDTELRSGRFPSAGKIAEGLEVSVKTVRRDIEYLRSMLGAPIEYDPARRGFYYTDQSFRLGAVRMTGREYLAMLLSSRVFSQYRNTPYYQSLLGLFTKMKEFLSGEIEVDPDLFETSVLYYGGPVTSIPDTVWTAVTDALREKKTLRFRYRRPGAPEEADYSLETYRVVGYRGDWYCVGRCPERQAIRIFSMARMNGFGQGPAYKVPASFKLKDYVRGDFGMFLEGKEYPVEIEFDAIMAPFIRERVWGGGQKVRETRDRGIVLSFTAASLKELTFWVLSYGRHARVLSPSDLADRVREEVQAMAKA